MSKVDQERDYAVKFLFWLRDIGTPDEHVQGILRHFPNNKLPAEFERYAESLSNPTYTNEWAKKKDPGRVRSPEDLQKIKFGEKVKNIYSSCVASINNKFEPLWIEPHMLPSGVGVSQYLLYIRKQIFVYRAIENIIQNILQLGHSSSQNS